MPWQRRGWSRSSSKSRFLQNEVPLVLKQGELYVTCAVAGAAVVALAPFVGLSQTPTVLVAAAITFGLRAGSIALGWSLPVYKSRPPRN